MFPNFGTSEHPTTNTQHPTSSGLKMLGEAIVKGMAVTAKNFFGSYVSKERLTTVQYPEEHLVPKENTRQFPFLVYDGDDWEKGLRCVALSLIHISEPTRRTPTSYAVFCLKKKKMRGAVARRA